MSSTERTRRGFLALGGSALAVAATGTAAAAGARASTAPAQLWRLDHQWGFPLGPKGCIECNCTVCAAHATNKLFFSRADAENGRAHVGCRCVAEPVAVGGRGRSGVDVVRALRSLSRDGRSIDRRHPGVADALGGASDLRSGGTV